MNLILLLNFCTSKLIKLNNTYSVIECLTLMNYNYNCKLLLN